MLRMWMPLVTVLVVLSGIHCAVNIYMDETEVKRTLGIAGELYYMREGVMSLNALHNRLPISAHMHQVHLTWQSTLGKTIPYAIGIDVEDNKVLGNIKLNISHVGEIPTAPETFSIAVPCVRGTGTVGGHRPVNLSIHINVTFNRVIKNMTHINIQRAKECGNSDILHHMHSPATDHHGTAASTSTHTLFTNVFYIADVCALCVIAITAMFVCWHNMRNGSRNVGGGAGRGGKYAAGGDMPRSEDSDGGVVVVRRPPLRGADTVSDRQSSTFMARVTPIIPHNLFTGTSPFSQKSGGSGSYTSFRRVPAYALTDQESKDLQERIAELTVERCRVRLKSVMLEGTFGRMYHGTYTLEGSDGEQSVLVKTVTDHASQSQISVVVQEGMTMYGLTHRNVLPVWGVVSEGEDGSPPPLLIYPYNGYRNLKRFLQKCKLCAEGVARTLTTQEVIDMVLQVVQGMQYLHTNMLKHKDLAARNCVVDDKLRIQITDNALSRDLFPADYHCLGDNENRPIKWLAIESLQYNLFVFQSDVWSFGVLLWEFMTLAQQPYVEIDPFEMEAYLRDGYRLAQPVNCPDELFAMMAYCWAMRTEERPSFKQLQVCLQEFYMQLTKYV